MKMQVPSGRIFCDDDLELSRMMIKYGFIRRSDKPFTLNSGISSNIYVYGREDITDNQRFEWTLGLKMARIIRENSKSSNRQTCLIGIPTAGTVLAQAIAMLSFCYAITVNKKYICHRIMRQKLKKHGKHPKWVNGDPDLNKHIYWTIDNVVTNADSKFEANNRLREDGYPVDSMPSFILVDRQQGGVERMKKEGFKHIVVAYYLLDLTFVFGELGLWPKNMVKAVEEEIKAHQF